MNQRLAPYDYEGPYMQRSLVMRGGFTGTLIIRYSSLTPIGQPIRMRSWIERREGRKTFIMGSMHLGDQLCAEAEGIFIQPKISMLEHALDCRCA